MVLLGVAEHALYYLLVNVDLHDDTVGIAENLIALFVEHVAYRTQIGALGYGARDITHVVKHRKPHAHPVLDTADIVGVHLVVAQLAYDLLALGGIVDKTDEGGAQLDIGDVLRNVAPDAAVNDLDLAGIAPGRDILILRKTLDVDKHRAYYNYRHENTSRAFLTFYHSPRVYSTPNDEKGRGRFIYTSLSIDSLNMGWHSAII